MDKYQIDLKEEYLIKEMNSLMYELPKNDQNESTVFRDLPLIYIVGAPRSGTTFLSQALSYSLEVGYINNLIARFWTKPSLGILLSNRLLEKNGRDTISFSSRHGTTSTIGDPHEFGNLWTEIFNLSQCKTHHLTKEEQIHLDDVQNKYLLEDEILVSFKKPVLFKNIICGFHAEYLTKIHPNSLFIFIERNNIDTISSILKVRKERLNDVSKWWSLKPKSFQDVLSDDPTMEVTRQVIYSKREFIQELSKPNVNTYYLKYEDFIQNPNFYIEDIAKSVSSINNKAMEFRLLDLPSKQKKSELNEQNDKIRAFIDEIKGAQQYEYH